jgi:hypothetical protein
MADSESSRFGDEDYSLRKFNSLAVEIELGSVASDSLAVPGIMMTRVLLLAS